MKNILELEFNILEVFKIKILNSRVMQIPRINLILKTLNINLNSIQYFKIY